MEGCIFCEIIADRHQADVVGENELAKAFVDINPKAPVHVLVVPKTHYERPDQIPATTLSSMFDLAREVAIKKGLDQTGYRQLINTGRHAGQTVDHVHLHVLGGRASNLLY